MARRAPDDDEDERFDRTETLLEKSDRLAREYSREREVRQRTDRVRRLEGAPDTDSGVRAANARTRARVPALSQEGTQVQAAPRAEPEPEPRRQTTKEREAARDKGPTRAPAPQREPPRKSRIKTADRPAAAASQHSSERAEPLPTSPPVAPKPQKPPARSALDQLAVELEELLRELVFGWRALSTADRVTVGCCVGVIAGVLMPWVSDPAHAMRVGLLSGGVIHLGIALLALYFVSRSSALRGLRMTRRDELAQHRRISLWLVLLGAGSTLAGAYLLLLYGLSRSPDWAVQVHFGLYWTLVSGTGLSYGGYARFSDVRR